jgi:hypothetical protein
MEAEFRDVCTIEADDGLEFARDSVRGEEIRSTAEYDGVRLRLDARHPEGRGGGAGSRGDRRRHRVLLSASASA